MLLKIVFLSAFFLGCKTKKTESTADTKATMQEGQNRFVSGIYNFDFETRAGASTWGRQRSLNWCWAASSQMILNYHGINITQEQVVERLLGSRIDRPATENEIITALNEWQVIDRFNNRKKILARAIQINDPNIIDNLHFEKPYIIGIAGANPGQVGHAYVLTALRWAFNPLSQKIPLQMGLRDPWPTNQSQIEVDWNYFAQRKLAFIEVSVVDN